MLTTAYGWTRAAVAAAYTDVRYTLLMKTYLVGGAVRDELLGLPVRERDWVVVGATRRGDASRRATSRSARTSRSSCIRRPARSTRSRAPSARPARATAASTTALLARRDARAGPGAARPDDQRDRARPRHGAAHRSLRRPARSARALAAPRLAAFVEDPVRVLRVARFAARFAPLGFRVAPETMALMREIAARGELDALVPERVWQETQRALEMPAPRRFFEVLREANALAVIFPEVDALFGVPQPEQWHPEIDTGVHTMMVLDQAARLSDDPVVRFAALDSRSRQGHDAALASGRATSRTKNAASSWSTSCASGCAFRTPIASSACWSRAIICTRTRRRSCAPRRCSICSKSGRVPSSRALPAVRARLRSRCARPQRTRGSRLSAGRVSAPRARAGGREVKLDAEARAGLMDRRSPSTAPRTHRASAKSESHRRLNATSVAARSRTRSRAAARRSRESGR